MTKRTCTGGGICQEGQLPCRYWGADMDMDPFCVHPEAMRRSPTFGLYTRAMSAEGLCTHGEKGGYQLWELDRNCRECRGSALWVKSCKHCAGTGVEPELKDVDA
jgi:hypothetical protein